MPKLHWALLCQDVVIEDRMLSLVREFDRISSRIFPFEATFWIASKWEVSSDAFFGYDVNVRLIEQRLNLTGKMPHRTLTDVPRPMDASPDHPSVTHIAEVVERVMFLFPATYHATIEVVDTQGKATALIPLHVVEE